MEKYLPILMQCDLFEGIAAEDIPGMLACLGATVRVSGKGSEILAEGQSAEFVGILLSGSAHVARQDYYGNRSIVNHVAPGELFGESFACAGVAQMPVSVIANETCQVMFIHCRRITVGCSNACGFHSQLIYNLLRIVARRNLQFHQKLEITANRTTREKLMAYLLSQAKEKNADSFTIPYDRQALADYLGVERSAMSAELSKLKQDGIIDFHRSSFTIL